jgi:hypothetical protein
MEVYAVLSEKSIASFYRMTGIDFSKRPSKKDLWQEKWIHTSLIDAIFSIWKYYKMVEILDSEWFVYSGLYIDTDRCKNSLFEVSDYKLMGKIPKGKFNTFDDMMRFYIDLTEPVQTISKLDLIMED